jgi:hypothetical protein
LNQDPFTYGCNKDTVICGMPVSFRQMCGLQTPLRPCPINPKQYQKQVLYYDGKLYNGWQTVKKEEKEKEQEKEVMSNKQLWDLLNQLWDKKIPVAEAYAQISLGLEEEKTVEKIVEVRYEGGGGCQY